MAFTPRGGQPGGGTLKLTGTTIANNSPITVTPENIPTVPKGSVPFYTAGWTYTGTASPLINTLASDANYSNMGWLPVLHKYLQEKMPDKYTSALISQFEPSFTPKNGVINNDKEAVSWRGELWKDYIVSKLNESSSNYFGRKLSENEAVNLLSAANTNYSNVIDNLGSEKDAKYLTEGLISSIQSTSEGQDKLYQTVRQGLSQPQRDYVDKNRDVQMALTQSLASTAPKFYNDFLTDVKSGKSGLVISDRADGLVDNKPFQSVLPGHEEENAENLKYKGTIDFTDPTTGWSIDSNAGVMIDRSGNQYNLETKDTYNPITGKTGTISEDTFSNIPRTITDSKTGNVYSNETRSIYDKTGGIIKALPGAPSTATQTPTTQTPVGTAPTTPVAETPTTGSTTTPETPATAGTAQTGYLPDEVVLPTDSDLVKSRKELARTLRLKREESKGTLEAGLSEYEKGLTTQKGEYEKMLQERFNASNPDLQRNISEEFAGNVGLRSGAFQKTLASELANRQQALASSLAEYQLNQQSDLSAQKLGLSQQMASMQSQDAATVGNMAYSTDVNVYLQRLGYDQQMDAMNQQFIQNLQLQRLQNQAQLQSQREQAYGSVVENEKNRQFQRSLLYQQQQYQNYMDQQAANERKRTAGWSMAGGAVGGALGAYFGGPQGAVIGYGLGSGLGTGSAPLLAAAMTSNSFNNGGYAYSSGGDTTYGSSLNLPSYGSSGSRSSLLGGK